MPLGHKRPACMLLFAFFEGGLFYSLPLRGRGRSSCPVKASYGSCSACHELLCSRAFLFIVLRSAQHPQIPRFLQIFRGIWPMPLSLLNHSTLALFAQRTRIPATARSIGFCAIWVCFSSSSIIPPNCKKKTSTNRTELSSGRGKKVRVEKH